MPKKKAVEKESVQSLEPKTIHVKLAGLAPFKRNGVMHTRMPRPMKYGPGEIPATINYEHVENLLHYEPTQRFLSLPSDLLEAFFTQEQRGAICRILGPRKGFAIANKAQAKIFVKPEFPLLTRNGNPIEPNGFDKRGIDEKAGIYASVDKAIVRGSGKRSFVITVRPVVMLPWEVEFDIELHRDDDINEHTIKTWLQTGGIEIGLGSHSPKFGRFRVEEFVVTNGLA